MRMKTKFGRGEAAAFESGGAARDAARPPIPWRKVLRFMFDMGKTVVSKSEHAVGLSGVAEAGPEDAPEGQRHGRPQRTVIEAAATMRAPAGVDPELRNSVSAPMLGGNWTEVLIVLLA
jgi:hypothetical protein